MAADSVLTPYRRADGGVDSIAIETMSDLEEALCALRGALRASDLPVTVTLTLTLDRKDQGFFTPRGDPLQGALRTLADAGATAVGANCSTGSEALLEACPSMLAASPLPVVIQPNAGLPELQGGRPVYRQTPADFARDMAQAARMGAAAVGGGCGTDERFVAALRAALDGDTGPEPGRPGPG